MRPITAHRVNSLNDAIQIIADERDPSCGNASHEYALSLTHTHGVQEIFVLRFQRGPIAEAGFNGLSNEALLAVLIDRLRGFAVGSHACRENSLALTKLEEAMHWLNHRTQDRMQRGVEGTHEQ